MADTQTAAPRITRDAPRRYQLTEAAIEHAKRHLNASNIDAVAQKLGYSRQTFWRLRHDKGRKIPLAEATAVAQKIGLTIDQAFRQAPRG